jgi:hypothetical protein
MGTWSNSDGLYIKFGTDEVTVTDGGELKAFGALHEVELEIDLDDLSTSANTFLSDTVTIPNGARIEKVVVIVETAATSGGSATLDIGLIDQDRTTAFDDDGLVAALALAEMSDAGAVIEFMNGADSTPAGESGDGALVGTTLSNTGLVIASANTAVFTGGHLKVRIYWYNP